MTYCGVVMRGISTSSTLSSSSINVSDLAIDSLGTVFLSTTFVSVLVIFHGEARDLGSSLKFGGTSTTGLSDKSE